MDDLLPKLLPTLLPTDSDTRRVPRQNLHLTLHFLGEVDDERSGEVVDLAAKLPDVRSVATISEVTGYPSRQRARVVVARLEADPLFTAWHEALGKDWPMAARKNPFEPHVTLARCRGGVEVTDAPGFAGLSIELLPPAAYISRTHTEGVRYLPLQPAG